MAEEEGSILKLIMNKGPREGETLTYPPRSVVRIGRVVRGNTIGIKDAGISTKHLIIEFDHHLSRWTLCDLDSSNGTVLNGNTVNPHTPSCLTHGDCIKIGELTSITVNIEAASPVQLRKNPRRQPKSSAVDKVIPDLELGGDVDLGENEPVQKRNLRGRSRKNDLETLGTSNRRVLRSSKAEEVISIPPQVQQIPDTNVDPIEPSVAIEPKPTRRGRKRAMQAHESDETKPAADGKRTRGRRTKTQQLENAAAGDLGEISSKDCQVREKAAAGGLKEISGKDCEVAEDREDGGLKEISGKDCEVADDREDGGLKEISGKDCEVADDREDGGLKEISGKDCEVADDREDGGLKEISGKDCEVADDREDGGLKEISGKDCEVADDREDGGLKEISGKVCEVAEDREDGGGESMVKDSGSDMGQVFDLEKMTLGDFFDYLEVQLPKEIYEKSEKILQDMEEKTRRYKEFMLQRHGNEKQ